MRERAPVSTARTSARLPADARLPVSPFGYQARFAAIYLPSLVQSATAQLHDNNTSSLPMLNKGINWTVQVIILAEQYASRFVREHPEEALQLFEGLTYCVSQASRLPEAAFEEVSISPPPLESVSNG